MNKTEFVDYIAETCELTKKDAKVEIDDVLNGILGAMAEDGELNIQGFGKFYVQEVEARERRNPLTGETFMADAHKTPKFKYAQNVKKDFR